MKRTCWTDGNTGAAVSAFAIIDFYMKPRFIHCYYHGAEFMIALEVLQENNFRNMMRAIFGAPRHKNMF
jgi:hypothetical protein